MQSISKRIFPWVVLVGAWAFAGSAAAQEAAPREAQGAPPSADSARAATTAQDDTDTPLSAAANTGQESVGDVLPEPLRSWNGWRPWLSDKGLTLAATYQGDVLGNVAGGVRRGATYMGRLQTTLEFDPEQALGWKGGLLHVSSFQIHGVAMSPRFTGSINQLSDLEAVATTRLFELWFEQRLPDKRLTLRVGQLAIDQEFFLSPFYGIAIGGAYGWPTIATANLPSGGPAYPLAAPAARVKWAPDDHFTFLLGLFDGDPAGTGPGNPQQRNRYGTNFRLSDPPLLIAEGQFGYDAGEKPGTIRLGGWRHFGKFADQRFSSDGLSLSAPSSNGLPLYRRGDFGLYAVFDQQVWKRPNERESAAVAPGVNTGVYIFGRASISPADRNPIDFYVDGGASFLGMIDGRPYDKFAFLGSYSKISPRLSAADFDARFFSGNPTPVRAYEALVEATYSWRLAPGVFLQPNVQYVMHPGAGAADPLDPLGLRKPRNATVVGLRTTIQY
ncbi:MAG: carbohydrate porin [Hyphomicrobiales bacterium]|nr:carbohydrate porin [Hyphomicrobiales bacterium]